MIGTARHSGNTHVHIAAWALLVAATWACDTPLQKPQERAGSINLLFDEVRTVHEAAAGHPEFGNIIGAAIDGRSRAFVLDAATMRIVVLDSSGTQIGSLAGPGRGPGELAQPLSVKLVADTLLYVLDAQNGLIMYNTRDTLWTTAQSIRVLSGASDFCVIGGKLFVHAWMDSLTVHETDLGGQVLSSGGPQFGLETPRPGPRTLSNFGKIHCADEDNVILDASTSFGQVHFLSTTTLKMLAADTLEWFKPWTILPVGKGFTKLESRDGSDEVLGFVALDHRKTLIQLLRRPTDSTVLVTSCLLNAPSKRCSLPDTTIPVVLAARRDGLALLLTSEIEQKVKFARLRSE